MNVDETCVKFWCNIKCC